MPPPPAAGELVIDRLAVKYTCYAQTARAGKKSAGFIVKFTFERGEGSGGRAQTNVKGGECKDVEQIPSVIEANIRAKLCALGRRDRFERRRTGRRRRRRRRYRYE